MDLAILILSLTNLLAICFLVFLYLKGKRVSITDEFSGILGGSFEKQEKTLKEEMSLNRREIADSEKRLREELSTLFKGFGEPIDKRMSEFASTQSRNFELFSSRLTEVIERNEAKIEKVRETVEKKLENIQKDNAEKLEAMRKTVDEKLQSTLEKRLGESFKQVSERLESVHAGLGEMKNLATDVGGLKKVLTNIKTRGIWGEVQLSGLLEQMLSPEQYSKNVAVKRDGKERVEYAIKLPGTDDGNPVWLPVDSKFPQEDYHRLLDAYDQGDAVAINNASKQLEQRIRTEAKNINEKYIDPPNTTDFAIMFLPYESLYAEVVRRPGLSEEIQGKYRVTVTCPSTLGALLTSLRMGFNTLTIQERSSEVWELLGAVKTQFGKFAGLLEKTQKQLKTVTNTIEEATKKTKKIEGKLRKVQELPQASSKKVSEKAEGSDDEEDFSDPQEGVTTMSDDFNDEEIRPEDIPF